MKKIVNPFKSIAEAGEYNCFGCSPANEAGLHLEFWEDGDEIISRWNPDKKYEGWTGVLHGGIQATLMDETAAWLVFIKLNTAGVTSRMEVSYSRAVFISKGCISVRARLISLERNIAKIKCSLADGEDRICAEATVVYFCFPEKIAREKYFYPGREAFYSV